MVWQAVSDSRKQSWPLSTRQKIFRWNRESWI